MSKKVELWDTSHLPEAKLDSTDMLSFVYSFPFLSSFLFRSEAGNIIKIWIIYEEPLKWVACRLVKESRADTKLHFFSSLTINDIWTVCLENKHMNLKLWKSKSVKHWEHLHWCQHKCVFIIIIMCKIIFCMCIYT